jgi:hypothetical protein
LWLPNSALALLLLLLVLHLLLQPTGLQRCGSYPSPTAVLQLLLQVQQVLLLSVCATRLLPLELVLILSASCY